MKHMEFFLRELCTKLGLKQRVIGKLEGCSIYTCNDFVNLTERDIRSLNLTVFQAAAVRQGIHKLKSVSMVMTSNNPHNSE